MKREQQLLLELVRNLDHPSFRVSSEKVDGLDWEVLFQETIRHKLLPILYPRVQEWIPVSARASWDQRYSRHQARMELLSAEVTSIMRRAKQEGLRLVLHKGLALSALIYGDVYARHVGDLDFLIKEDDIKQADRLLREMGYYHACGKEHFWEIQHDDDYLHLPHPVLRDRDHHEYFGYYKEAQVLHEKLYVAAELGRYLHQTVKQPHIMQFLSHTQEIAIGEESVLTFDLPHTFLALCENAFDDAEEWHTSIPSLKNYVDLYYLMQGRQIDWAQVRAAAINYGMYEEVRIVMEHMLIVFEGRLEDQMRGAIQEWLAPPPDYFPARQRYMFNWEIDFITRLFMDGETHEQEVKAMALKHCFSERNRSFTAPHRIASNQPSPMVQLHTSNHHVLPYYLECDQHHLHVHILIEDPLYENLHQHEIFLHLISGVDDALLSHEVSFSSENGAIVVRKKQTEAVKVVASENNRKVTVSYPLAIVPIRGQKVAYGISVMEIQWGDIAHWVTPTPFNKEFWNHPPVLQMEEALMSSSM